MIPKIIHYCWVGGNPKSELVVKCIESWRRYCPDYEIREWNESNYDFHSIPYMSDAYNCKKWGFVPDYARLDIIYKYGGIYLDTDVEIIKPLDSLLGLDAFAGMEEEDHVALGLGFGARPGNEIVKMMRDMYNDLQFVNDDQYLSEHASPVYQTDCLMRLGLKAENVNQRIGNLTVFSTEYFCPKDVDTGIVTITDNSYSIHHFDGSWASDTVRYGYHLKWDCIKRYGIYMGRIVYLVKYAKYIYEHGGLSGLIRKFVQKTKRGK